MCLIVRCIACGCDFDNGKKTLGQRDERVCPQCATIPQGARDAMQALRDTREAKEQGRFTKAWRRKHCIRSDDDA